MIATATLLFVALTPATVAVVDLSTPHQDEFAEALRKAPGLKGRVLTAAQTAAVVKDAGSLGLACRVTDDKCLEKLMIMADADELVAFSFDRGSVKLAQLSGGKTVRAKVKFSAPSTTAQLALTALGDAAAPSATPGDLGKPVEKDPVVEPPVKPPEPEPKDPRDPKDPPVGEEAGGVSPGLAVGIIGGAVGVGCLVGALGISVGLAQDQRDAQDPNVRESLPDDYLQRETTFWALAAGGAFGLVAAGVGVALFMNEEPLSEP